MEFTEFKKLGRLVIWLRYIEAINMWLFVVEQVRGNPISGGEYADNVAYRNALDQVTQLLGHCVVNMILLPINDERADNPNDWDLNFGY